MNFMKYIFAQVLKSWAEKNNGIAKYNHGLSVLVFNTVGYEGRKQNR